MLWSEVITKLVVDKGWPKVLGIDSYIPPDFSIYETAKTLHPHVKASYDLIKHKAHKMKSSNEPESEIEPESISEQEPAPENEVEIEEPQQRKTMRQNLSQS